MTTTSIVDEVAEHLRGAGVQAERARSIPVDIPAPAVRMPRAVEDELAAEYRTERDTARQTADSTIYPIPSDAALDGEYTPSGSLEEIGERLIARHFGQAHADCRIVYLWKDKAPKRKGRLVAGTCTKPSGLLRHFSEADFVIALSADLLREAGATYTDVEAVVYHELAHIVAEETDEGIEGVRLVGHDFEGFESEMRLYGNRARTLKPLVRAVQQLPLDGLA